MTAMSALAQGFWAAAAELRLVVQRCDSCGTLRHYPQELCARCLSADWSWTELSGRGAVYTYTVTHQAFHPDWNGRVPYAVVTVELEEGVRMVTDMHGDDLERLRIGAPVEVHFSPGLDGVIRPRFRPTSEATAARGAI
jgi:uncharacterized OB-fold protein